MLDKDTLFDGLEAEVLAAHGRPEGEREGDWYDEHVKRHEYGALAAAACEIRAAGCPVLLVAPFTTALRDADAWAAFAAGLGGAPVRLVWVGCDPGTLRRRIESRGRAKDAPKLADFAAFVARVRPGEPPLVPHLAVDTSDGAPPVADQLDAQLDGRMDEALPPGAV
jgi:hypothetical protein